MAAAVESLSRGYGVDKRRAAAGSGLLRNSYTDKTTLVKVQYIDTDAVKTQLATMLARTEPGPGYIHLPCGMNGEDVRGWDFESIAELTAEYRRQMPSKGGYTHYQWFKRPGRANHRLDCAVLCLAGLALSRLRIDDCNLQRIEARELAREKSYSESNQPVSTIKYGAINSPLDQASSVFGVQKGSTRPTPYGVQKGGEFWPPHQFGDNW